MNPLNIILRRVMMKNRKLRSRYNAWLLVLLLSCVLAGCLGGGAGGGGLGSLFANGGVSGTGISLGPVSGFGSVIVNNSTYNTDSAVFFVNGAGATQADLEVGQVVRVTADYATNQAQSVEYVETVQGPIQSIDSNQMSLVVLGQTVVTNATTLFNDVNFADLVVGDIVEVSGFRTQGGEVLATYLERDNTATTYRVLGSVSMLNPMTFLIGGLIVDYSGANLPDGNPVEGALVEVEGPAANFALATVTLVASEVEDGLEVNANDGEEVEIEGLVTTFTSVNNFAVNGQSVVTNASTQFENGSVMDLALNVRVEVEGEYVGGVIQAETVEIEEEGNVEVLSTIENVNPGAGTITMLGITFTTDASTTFKDEGPLELKQFSLNDVFGGDYVEVIARQVGANNVATLVKRKSFENKAKLKGVASAVNTATFTVTTLGIELFTDGATNFEDANGMMQTQAQFFLPPPPNVMAGDVIEVEWQPFVSTVTPVSEMEVEN